MVYRIPGSEVEFKYPGGASARIAEPECLSNKIRITVRPCNEGVITGRVLDGRTYEPVSGAEVVVFSETGFENGCESDAEGWFRLQWNAGTEKISLCVSKNGYKTYRTQLSEPYSRLWLVKLR